MLVDKSMENLRIVPELEADVLFSESAFQPSIANSNTSFSVVNKPQNDQKFDQFIGMK